MITISPTILFLGEVGHSYPEGSKILWFGKKNGQVKRLASSDIDNMIAYLKMQPGANAGKIDQYLNKIDDRYFSLITSKGRFKYSFSGAIYDGDFEKIPVWINEISKI